MYQVKNLLNRTSVPLDPEKNMNASEDFLLLLLHAHVIAAAKGILSYDFTESRIPTYVARSIVNSHVLLPVSFPDEPVQEQDQMDGVNLMPENSSHFHLSGIFSMMQQERGMVMVIASSFAGKSCFLFSRQLTTAIMQKKLCSC